MADGTLKQTQLIVESYYICSGKPRSHQSGNKASFPLRCLCVIFIGRKKNGLFASFLLYY